MYHKLFEHANENVSYFCSKQFNEIIDYNLIKEVIEQDKIIKSRTSSYIVCATIFNLLYYENIDKLINNRELMDNYFEFYLKWFLNNEDRTIISSSSTNNLNILLYIENIIDIYFNYFNNKNTYNIEKLFKLYINNFNINFHPEKFNKLLEYIYNNKLSYNLNLLPSIYNTINELKKENHYNIISKIILYNDIDILTLDENTISNINNYIINKINKIEKNENYKELYKWLKLFKKFNVISNKTIENINII